MTAALPIAAARAAVLACLAALGCVTGGCETSQAAAPGTAGPRDVAGEVTLRIEGMACDACASRLETSLRKVDGITGASVDFAQKRARVSFDPARTNVKAIVEAIEGLGFQGSPDDKR